MAINVYKNVVVIGCGAASGSLGATSGLIALIRLGVIMVREHILTVDTEHAMTEQPSTLYAKLLGETAPISWQELQPFFARGALLLVEGSLDLIVVAQAVAENDQSKVTAWLAAEQLSKVEDNRAQDLLTRDPLLWAVVVAPWILVQERAEAPKLQ